MAPIDPLIEKLRSIERVMHATRTAWQDGALSSPDAWAVWQNAQKVILSAADQLESRSGPAQKDAPAWQPIETAQKSANAIIVYAPSYAHPVVVAYWDDEVEAEGGQTWRAADAYWDRVNPTHWMSLPDPPGAQKDAPEPETSKSKT